MREWTISDDDRILTLYLRRGMNWSDGMPVTAEDFRFWHQRVLLNETLTPKIQERYRSAGEEPMTMEVIDTFTVEYRFTEPKPDVVFQWAEYRVLVPQHYLSEYHIDHNQDANDHALEAGYESWDKRFIAYYGGDRYGQNSALSKTPTIDTYVLLLREDDTQTYERNPFYWKIDPDGNQLPYVDHLIILRHSDYERLLLHTIAGEIHFSILRIDDLSALMDSSESGGYHILKWRNGSMSTPLAITLNYTHSDPIKRELFNSRDLRRALSLAIDRDEMAEVLYSGLSEPWTPSVPFYWTGFEDWMSTHYTYHDVGRANELLDRIGLNTNNNGERQFQDGQRVSIRGAFTDASLASAMELLRKYWADVGITLEVAKVEYSEWKQSVSTNSLDATFAHTGGGAEVFARLWRYPMRLIPPWHWHEYDSESPYMWSDWYVTGGNSGDSPPAEIEELFYLSDWFAANAHLPRDSQEYLDTTHRMLELNVEGLYSFGTVSPPPIIVAVNKNLRNIPEDAVWLFGGMQPFNVDTFYFVTSN